ncbi:DUF5937 family protein [Arthrobacter ginkgonis]|uniref:DUF5937 family protein n=1 Tax=Arthrobacter ginkgonis TaxID=1630594 RepID=A0ABP7D4E6_9MICC
MAIVLKLAGFDPAHIHVVPSPLTEMMSLLHALAEPDHHLEAKATLDDVSGAFDAGMLDEFRFFSPLWARFRCRLFFPLDPHTSALPHQLQAILDLSMEQFMRLAAEGVHGYARPLPLPQELLHDDSARQVFLDYCRARSTTRFELAESLLADPEAFRHRLANFLLRAQDAFFGQEWVHVHEAIHRSVARAAAGIRTAGPAAVLSQLSSSAHGLPDLQEVRFDKLQQRTVHLGGRELVLVPSVHIGPHLTIKDTAGFPVVIHYAAQSVEEERLGIRELRERLAALASEARMEIFRHLSAEPITTSELALRLGQNPAQVSRSLGVLRDASLLVSERRGKLVYYRINTARVLNLGPDILSTLVR